MKWMRVSDNLLLNMDFVQEIFAAADVKDKDGKSLGPAVLARMHGGTRTIILGTFEDLEQAKAFLRNKAAEIRYPAMDGH